MPRVRLNRKQYKVNDFGAWIVGQLYKTKSTQQKLADALGIKQPSLSYKIKNNKFDYADLLTIVDFFGLDDEEIVKIMRM